MARSNEVFLFFRWGIWDVPLYCSERLGASEVAGQIQARHIQCVDSEMVMMQTLVVPGRAGAVVSGIYSLHIRIPGEPIGVIVDTSKTMVSAARLFATYCNPVRVDALM